MTARIATNADTDDGVDLVVEGGRVLAPDRVRRLVVATMLVLASACERTNGRAEPVPDPAATSPSTSSAADTASTPSTVPALTPLPTQPDGVPFPNDDWPTSTPSAGPDAVAAIVDEALATESRFGTIDAVLVVQGGSIVVEAYGDGWGPSRVHPSWSIAKSVNAAHEQADRPLTAPPGTAFNYSTGSTAIVGRVIGDLIGTDDEFARWSDARLFDPLGIDSVELTFDADGYWVAGYGADMTARDHARFGLLYLRDGVWDGRRILPEGWVDTARTATPLAPPYGSGFWIDVNAPDTFSAEGFFGQKIVIVPDSDLVVVVLAQNLDDDLSTQLAAALIDVLRTG